MGDPLRKVKPGSPLPLPAGRFSAFADAATKAIVKQPAAVYIEKVHEEGDFSGLGRGASFRLRKGTYADKRPAKGHPDE